jgi:hypothetical protein
MIRPPRLNPLRRHRRRGVPPIALAAAIAIGSAGALGLQSTDRQPPSQGALDSRAPLVAATAETPAADCDIKGNISPETGEHIYHLPGQKYYAKTRISPGKGERWFCSETEARAAGWRRSKV